MGALFAVLYIFEVMGRPHVDPLFRIDISPWPWRLLVHPAVQAVPGLFMLYCFLVFQEGRRVPLPLLILFALQVLLEVIVLLPEGGLGPEFPRRVGMTMDAMQLGFVALALYWTLKGWRDDLVQDRRLLRWVVISLQGGLIFLVVVVENVLVARGVLDAIQAHLLTISAIAMLLTMVVLLSMKFEKTSLRIRAQDRSAPSQTPAGADPEPLALNPGRFEQLFEVPRLYRQPGLTITGLARQLGLPEYRLREFIHGTLGHRNFNAMLHQYRIAAACQLLCDPARRNEPVVRIAFEVGYKSATSFNSAFRELQGVTPSEYRRRLLDAEPAA